MLVRQTRLEKAPSATSALHARACSVAKSYPLCETHGLQPARLLCLWNFPGKNTTVGGCFLLQGIFLTQGSNPCFLHLLQCQVDSLPLSHLGSHECISIEYIWHAVYRQIHHATPLLNISKSSYWCQEKSNVLNYGHQGHLGNNASTRSPFLSSVVPFSSCPQSLPASESFPMSQLFA